MAGRAAAARFEPRAGSCRVPPGPGEREEAHARGRKLDRCHDFGELSVPPQRRGRRWRRQAHETVRLRLVAQGAASAAILVEDLPVQLPGAPGPGSRPSSSTSAPRIARW